MQHRDGDDEGQEEPVGHVDMRLFSLDDCPEENRQIRDPDQRQPDVDIPFRLCILLRLRAAQHIAGCGQYDEQLVSPKDEPPEIAAP